MVNLTILLALSTNLSCNRENVAVDVDVKTISQMFYLEQNICAYLHSMNVQRKMVEQKFTKITGETW